MLDSDVSHYKSMISNYKILDMNEIVELYKEWDDLKTDSSKSILEKQKRIEQIETILFKSNAKLVVSISNHYYYSGVPKIEIISLGNEGLLNAIRRFDYKKNVKLSTYASIWIKQSIILNIPKSRLLSISSNLNKKIIDILKCKKILERDLCRKPTFEEISKLSFIPEKEIVSLLNCIKVESLNVSYSVYEDNYKERVDLLESPYKNPEEKTISNFIRSEINKYLLLNLNLRDKEIIKYRYGFYGQENTFEEIASKFSLTRERIRQIQNKVIRDGKNNKEIAKLI